MTFKPSLINRFRRQLFSHLALVRIALVFFIILAMITVGLWLRQPAREVSQGLKQVYQDNLPYHDGRVNFLILGIGGQNHEGSDLTDTVLFVSVNSSTGDTFILSIPRDVWVPSLKAKINTAYHYGEKRQPQGGGLVLAKASVSETISQPVDFAAVVDFSTFSKFVDLLGGIEVEVEKTFDDYDYPITGKSGDLCDGDPLYRCRYEHVHFDAGIQHMDGSTALKFVRSRYSSDPDEGSDFARSRRQERVISGIQKKLISLDLVKQPKIYQDLFNLLTQSVKTDLGNEHLYQLLMLGLKMKSQVLRSAVLSEPEHLSHPPVSMEFGNQWVLLPNENVEPFVVSQLETPSSP